MIFILLGSPVHSLVSADTQTITTANIEIDKINIIINASSPEQLEVIDSIIEIADELSLAPDMTINALKVAWCESRYDPVVKNPDSTAKGVFQFIDGTWEGYGKIFWNNDFYTKKPYKYRDNIELALLVMKKYGLGDWAASKHCWS